MSPGIWQIAIVAVVIIVLFGRGRISGMMGDLGKGITSFKRGLKDEDESDSSASSEAPRISSSPPAAPASETTVEATREDSAS